MVSKNPYQVICIGVTCKLYDKCNDKCILNKNAQSYIKGCNYSSIDDCKHCSHKNKCLLLKPYSEKINKIESKRRILEKENDVLYEYISTWDEIENNIDKYGVDSVTDVVYFKRDRQKMIDRINDNNKLINLYREHENKLINEM